MTELYKKILIYAIPVLAVVVAAGGLFLALTDSKPARRRPDGLFLLADENLRYPVEAPDIEHESGAVGRFLRRTGIQMTAEYGPPREMLDRLILDRTGDLFLAAEGDFLEKAEAAELIHETRQVAVLVPVILIRSGNPHEIKVISDLINPDLRLAVADPRTSLLGSVTNNLFNKNEVSRQNLDNIRFVGDTAAETARAVMTDRADGAIVWRPVAERHRRNTEIVEIHSDKNLVSPIKIAVLNTAENKQQALRFADFISRPAGQEIFEMYGYSIEQP